MTAVVESRTRGNGGRVPRAGDAQKAPRAQGNPAAGAQAELLRLPEERRAEALQQMLSDAMRKVC
eukprot:4016681-Pyramimonas_sp.AAC.1